MSEFLEGRILMKLICHVITKDNVTFMIAVLGFLLSVYNFVHDRLQSSMRLSVSYKNHHITSHDEQGINISLCIENLVKEPIAISRMYLTLNSEKYEFFWVPQIIYHADLRQKDKVLDEIKLHSVALPCRLEGNGVIGGFFYVKLGKHITDQELENSESFITIYSNKGIKSYPITINNPSVEI